jgi:putative aldouronate transport system substrate-binding protein
MRRASKIMCLLIVMLFTVSIMLTGCGSASKNTTTGSETSVVTETTAGTQNAESTAVKSTALDTSKAVDLSMYLIGAPAKEYDLVLTELNKKTKVDLNASVAVSWIGWGDFATKYPLVLASGEPIDLIYASTWLNYYTQAQKGAFKAIEDLAPVYAPLSYKETTPDFLKQATVNGHLYALPPTFYQNAMMGYIVRGDLMKKYGMTSINSIDDYGKYLDAVVKNDKNLDPTGFMATSDGLTKYYVSTLNLYDILQTQFSPFYVDLKDPNSKIVNFLDRPEMPAFYAKMKDWSNKGYWPKSVLSNKDEFMLRDGKAASRLHNFDSWRSLYIEHPEYDVQYYPGWAYSFKTAAMQDGMAVPASAQNPERGLMLLEKLRQDQSYYNLLTYGIEGRHYEITADNMLKPLNTDAFAPEGYCSWGFKSLKFYKDPVGSPPTLAAVKEKLASMVIENKYLLFTPNIEPIKNENAAIINVMQQYEIPLRLGYVDPVKGLATLREKLKAAGIDKVITELQKQVDEYLKNSK